jgi:hypothetical protein
MGTMTVRVTVAKVLRRIEEILSMLYSSTTEMPQNLSMNGAQLQQFAKK